MSHGKLTGATVAAHNSKSSCWVIVHGKAYDVTEFLPGMSLNPLYFPGQSIHIDTSENILVVRK